MICDFLCFWDNVAYCMWIHLKWTIWWVLMRMYTCQETAILITQKVLCGLLKCASPSIPSTSCWSVIALCDPMDCSTPGFPVLHYLLEFAQTHVHWVSDAIQPSHPLLSPSSPAFNLSQHQGLFQFSSSHQVARVLELHFSPSNEYSGLISFRIDWFDLLAVQGTLQSLL